jgi:predicted alpha/beta hydrolase
VVGRSNHPNVDDFRLSPVNDASDLVSELAVEFRALDGTGLAGTLFYLPGVARFARVAVFNCGGGVPARAYRHFARYLASCGIPVLTYDYRGIGRSRPAKLRGFAASVEDWAEHDCGGAIAWLRTRYPSSRIIGIAHSIGGLLLGGAPNSSELSDFILICTHTGYYGDYRLRYRLPMAMLWHGLMPALTHALGYFPARRLGLGDDIPRGVALQWASRRGPSMQFKEGKDVGRARRALLRCRNVHGPALILSVTDDAFATEAGTHRLLSYFPGLKPRFMRVSPADVGARRVGHFGFFRRNLQFILWPRVLAYILQEPPRPLGLSGLELAQ